MAEETRSARVPGREGGPGKLLKLVIVCASLLLLGLAAVLLVGPSPWSRGEGADRLVSVSADGTDTGVALDDATGQRRLHLTVGEDAAFEVPGWLPLYPGTEPLGGGVMGNGQGRSGSFTLSTEDPVGEVVERCRQILKQAGFEVEVNTFRPGTGPRGGVLHGRQAGRSVSYQVAGIDHRTVIAVTFQD